MNTTFMISNQQTTPPSQDFNAMTTKLQTFYFDLANLPC